MRMQATPRTTEELDRLISRPDDGVLQAVSKASGNFAVLGAGGKMGFHLCLLLQRAIDELGLDSTVTAVSRFGAPHAQDRFRRAGITSIAADLSDPDQLTALPDFENIFFLAGMKFGSGANVELLEQANHEMPRAIAGRYRESRIVALSTGCVYSFVENASGGSLESGEKDPPGEYAQSCLRREQAFTEVASRCVLIRLNYSVELRYGVLVDIARKVFDNEPIDVETGYVNVIWQGDAIRHIVRSLEHASSPPTILNVAGSETLSVRELARAFGRRFSKSPQIRGSEQPTAWLSNASKSHALFGHPAISVRQMVNWIGDWIECGRELYDKPTKFELRHGTF